MECLAARHRVAFDGSDLARDVVSARWRRDGEIVVFAKPLTFMNLSGQAIQAMMSFYKVAVPDLLVVCDDVNLPLGRLRARPGGGEGGHNGLRSIAECLGTIDYARLRIGVGRGDDRRDLADHVLARFESDEAAGIERATARAADAVEHWVALGIDEVMNLYNRADTDSLPPSGGAA